MSTLAIREEDIMTDKQFDSIIEMVIQLLSRSKDLKDAENALLAIKRGGNTLESIREVKVKKDNK